MQLPGPGVFGPPARPRRGARGAPARRRAGRQPHRHRAVLRPERRQRADPRGAPSLPRRPRSGQQGRRAPRRHGRLAARAATRRTARRTSRTNLRDARTSTGWPPSTCASTTPTIPTPSAEVDRELFDRQLSAMIKARDEGLIAGIGLSSITARASADRARPHRDRHACRTPTTWSTGRRSRCSTRASSTASRSCRSSRSARRSPPTIPCSATRSSASTPPKLGRTPAQIALAWTLSVAPNVLLIPGTSSVAHLEENTAVADIELDDDTKRELDASPPDCDFGA